MSVENASADLIHLYELNLGRAYGAVLKKHRTAAGLSQEELAHRANMHSSAISFYERGLRQPTLYTVFVLAGVFGVRPSGLVAEVEAHQPTLDR